MVAASNSLLNAKSGGAEDVLKVEYQRQLARGVNADATALHELASNVCDPRDAAVILQTVADLDQMSTLAWRVAMFAVREREARGDGSPALPEKVAEIFREMGHCEFQMGKELWWMVDEAAAIKVDPTLTRGNCLLRIRDFEKEVDELRRRLVEDPMIAQLGWIHGVAGALEVMRLASYYERFADHAIAIAHRFSTLEPAGGRDL